MTFGTAHESLYNEAFHLTDLGEVSLECTGKHVPHSIFSKARQITVLWFSMLQRREKVNTA